MSERLQPHEIETLMRSAAMAPLTSQSARRILEAYKAIAADQERGSRSSSPRLGPAWVELRAVLNEMAKVSDG